MLPQQSRQGPGPVASRKVNMQRLVGRIGLADLVMEYAIGGRSL